MQYTTLRTTLLCDNVWLQQGQKIWELYTLQNLKKFELARIRTWNLLIRSQTRYPLRHGTKYET